MYQASLYPRISNPKRTGRTGRICLEKIESLKIHPYYNMPELFYGEATKKG